MSGRKKTEKHTIESARVRPPAAAVSSRTSAPITGDRSRDGCDGCRCRHDRVSATGDRRSPPPTSATTSGSCGCGCAIATATWPADATTTIWTRGRRAATTTTTTWCGLRDRRGRCAHGRGGHDRLVGCHLAGGCHDRGRGRGRRRRRPTSRRRRRRRRSTRPLPQRARGCATDGRATGGPARGRPHSNGCGTYSNRRTHVRCGSRSSSGRPCAVRRFSTKNNKRTIHRRPFNEFEMMHPNHTDNALSPPTPPACRESP